MAKSRSPAARLKLAFTAKTSRNLLPGLRRDLKKVLPHLPPHQLSEVVISLVGDETMSGLHATSHNDPTPTDVLTYELDHNDSGDVTEGQIVICAPEAVRRAGEHRITPGREVLLYALHGLLHLCGFDDRKKKDFDRMHATEDHILSLVGIGPLFHAAQASGKAAAKKPSSRASRKRPAAATQRAARRLGR